MLKQTPFSVAFFLEKAATLLAWVLFEMDSFLATTKLLDSQKFLV